MENLILPQYRDADDTLHPCGNPEYYEWWYFDARFDNGYSCVATFHWRNPFTSPHIPTVQVFIYAPDGKRHVGMAAIDPNECSSSPEKCDVKMGGNFARLEDNGYAISMHTRKCGVDLTYSRKVAGWKQNGDGYLYNDGEKKQGWIIAAPRSDVSGTLRIEGSRIPVTGHGYHDKNWGNFNIDDCFKGWYWGRLYDPVYTLIYYWLFPVDADRPVISRLLLAKNKQPVLLTDRYKLTVEKEDACQLTGKKIPSKIVIRSGDEDGLHFKCELLTTKTVETDRLPKLSQWDQYHWRFLGDYTLETDIGGKSTTSSGKAIHEHLLFR